MLTTSSLGVAFKCNVLRWVFLMLMVFTASASESDPNGIFRTSIYELKEVLKSKSYSVDEKTIVDRPIIKRAPGDLTEGENEVQRCTSIIAAKKKPTVEEIEAVLNECFLPISSELKDLGMKRFEIKGDSKLGELLSESTSSEEEPMVESLKPMLERAVGVLSELARKFDVNKDVVYEAFTKPFDDQIVETADWILGLTASCDAAEGLSAAAMVTIASKHDYSTAIPVPFPFIIPGGRFGEAYYWDTYWVIKGLLVTGNDATAVGQVRNFFSLVDTFGFVPNGLRTYYLDRSQVPVLSMCVSSIVNYFKEKNRTEEATNFMKEALPRLLKEYFSFWMNPDKEHVVVLNSDSIVPSQTTQALITNIRYGAVTNVLNRYHSQSGTPRIESYLVDSEIGKLFEARLAENKTAAKSKEEFFNSVRAAAESGWDYSTRWVRRYIEGNRTIEDNNPSMSVEDTSASQQEALLDIDTINVLPIDLNAMIYNLEKTILEYSSDLLKSFKQNERSPERVINALKEIQSTFIELVNSRLSTMYGLMWNDEGKYWADYYLRTMSQSAVISAGSVFPLLISELQPYDNLDIPKVLKEGWGIVPTGFKSGLQWDSPNVWPPLVQAAIEYLDKEEHSDKHLSDQALTIGGSFLRAAEQSFESNDAFYEKYDSLKKGSSGTGGEYQCQIGFGWTNGALLDVASRVIAKLPPNLEHTTSFGSKISWPLFAFFISSTLMILS